MWLQYVYVVHLTQVIGLTASVGVGKAKSMQQAVDHVLTLCANLDCRDISTVSENIEEINMHVNKPNEGAAVSRYLLVNCCRLQTLLSFAAVCSPSAVLARCRGKWPNPVQSILSYSRFLLSVLFSLGSVYLTHLTASTAWGSWYQNVKPFWVLLQQEMMEAATGDVNNGTMQVICT